MILRYFTKIFFYNYLSYLIGGQIMKFEQSLEQKQILSQIQIQSLKILSMNNYEVYEFINNELMENPLLDRKEPNEREQEKVIAEQKWLYEQNQKGNMKAFQESGNEVNWEIPDEAGEDVEEYVMIQLPRIPVRLKAIVKKLAGYMDEMGYLSVDKEEFCRENHCDEEMFEEGIELIQSLEPAGIGARNIEECLILQLKRKGIENDVLKEIIEYHLNDIALGHFQKIAKETGISLKRVKNFVKIIRNLEPKPLHDMGTEQVQYIVPDVILNKKEENGNWEIILNDGWMGTLKLNGLYEKMAKNMDNSEELEYIMKKINRAKNIMQSIEQRRNTIYLVCQYIVEQQSDYLEGKGAIKPITMSEIAERIGVHESTVGRAIRNKYIQHPRGTIAIREFFTKASFIRENSEVPSEEENVGRENIKEWIKEIIENEDKNKPYSDTKISKILEERHIKVARRTIAKYREEMQIPATSVRKSL